MNYRKQFVKKFEVNLWLFFSHSYWLKTHTVFYCVYLLSAWNSLLAMKRNNAQDSMRGFQIKQFHFHGMLNASEELLRLNINMFERRVKCYHLLNICMSSNITPKCVNLEPASFRKWRHLRKTGNAHKMVFSARNWNTFPTIPLSPSPAYQQTCGKTLSKQNNL